MNLMLNNNTIKKLNSKIERCNHYIEQNINVPLMEDKKEFYEKRISEIKHIRRTVNLWERSNCLWFNGSENDVYIYEDIVDYCNELYYNESPVDIIREGIFIPIGGSAIAPYDLREYYYLPSSLIEEDKDIKTISDVFDDFGEDIVQL